MHEDNGLLENAAGSQERYDGSPTRSSTHHHRHLRFCRRTILTRHLFAALAQRVWDFAVVLLLTVIGPKGSYGLVASYGITVNLTVAFGSPSLGAYMDKSNRLSAMVFVTISQNICTVISAASFLYVLFTDTGPEHWEWKICVIFIHIFGSLNNLFYGLANVVLERDWVVVIADDEEDWLRRITANLKSIDLSCDLVAPSLVSVLQLVSNGTIAVSISCANVFMVFLQYTALHQIYYRVPELADSVSHRSSSIDDSVHSTGGNIGGGALPIGVNAAPVTDEEQERKDSCLVKTLQAIDDFFSHGYTYLRQQSVLPGLALAMLYLTVLSFHMVMLSYLLMRGISVVIVGAVSGVSSGLGVLGTLAYEYVAARLGTIKSGLIAIWWQTCCLTIGVGALVYQEEVSMVDRDHISIGLFIGCVALSRFGLYMFDVAASQLFQHLVEEKERGVVGGFQRTLESLFELTSFLLVLFMPQPAQFPILAVISYCMTFTAATVFSVFSCREANRIAHPENQPIWPNHPEGNNASAPLPENPLIFNRLSTIWSVTSDASSTDQGRQTPAPTDGLIDGGNNNNIRI